MKYNPLYIESAIKAAVNTSSSDRHLYVYATINGYVVTDKIPPFSQNYIETAGLVITEHVYNFQTFAYQEYTRTLNNYK